MSEILERLYTGRGLAWAALVPAFDLAIIQAEQAEYEADRAMNLAQCGAAPAYPPLVLKLAESTPEPPKPEPFEWPDVEAPRAPWDEAAK